MHSRSGLLFLGNCNRWNLANNDVHNAHVRAGTLKRHVYPSFQRTPTRFFARQLQWLRYFHRVWRRCTRGRSVCNVATTQQRARADPDSARAALRYDDALQRGCAATRPAHAAEGGRSRKFNDPTYSGCNSLEPSVRLLAPAYYLTVPTPARSCLLLPTPAHSCPLLPAPAHSCPLVPHPSGIPLAHNPTNSASPLFIGSVIIVII